MSLGWRILIMLLIVAGAYFAGHHKGYGEADGEWQLKEAKISAAAEAKYQASVQDAKRRELRLSNELSDRAAQLYQENQHAETTIAGLRADARASRLRLSIAINTSSLCRAGATDHTAAAAGTGDEARADVVPGVADVILRIAGDSAKGVRERNALIDAYNAARETCNAVGVAP